MDVSPSASSSGSYLVVDPLTALSVSIFNTPGTFAALIGSGISRPALIPTGWDIVLALIRQVALVEGHDCEPEPAAWYRTHFGEDPKYGTLLAQLGLTPAERSQMIRKFIEPTVEERERELKIPTEAHRALAELVAGGYLRVIVTTNFDRLIELALGEIGIVPKVISGPDPDSILNTLPLAHNNCTLIKLHGDYQSVHILNTEAELAKYSEATNRLLDQVFREYGIVICGWSAEWDPALVSASRRELSPWFPTFWVARSKPQAHAQMVIQDRKAEVIGGMDADTFFRRLAGNITALASLEQPELLSVQSAQAAMKRFVADPTRVVQVRDLAMGESKRIRRLIEDEPHSRYTVQLTPQHVRARLDEYVGHTAVLRAILTTGCYWGEANQIGHWISCLELLAGVSTVQTTGTFEAWDQLRLFPALVAMYVGGVAAIANGNYETLAALLVDARATYANDDTEYPLLYIVNSGRIDPAFGPILHGQRDRRRHIPLAAYLAEEPKIWTALREYVPDEQRIQTYVDRFEYLVALTHYAFCIADDRHQWAPLGYAALGLTGRSVKPVRQWVRNGLITEREQWPPYRAGLFVQPVDELIKIEELLGSKYAV